MSTLHVNRRAAALAIFAALSLALSILPGIPARAEVSITPGNNSQQIKIVEVGDSYSAGNGAGGHYYGPNGCYRNDDNWAERYVKWLKGQGYAVTFINVACSGAVTQNLTDDRMMDSRSVDGLMLGDFHDNPDSLLAEAARLNLCKPVDDEFYRTSIKSATFDGFYTWYTVNCERWVHAQFDAIGQDTDLVLSTIGGDDINFSEIVKQCFLPGMRDPADCRHNVDTAKDVMTRTNDGMPARLATLFDQLHGKLRSDAHVAYMGYPYLERDKSFTLKSGIWPFNDDTYTAGKEVRDLGDLGDQVQLNAVKAANQRAGSNYVTFVGNPDGRPYSDTMRDLVKDGFKTHEPHAPTKSGLIPNPFGPDQWIHGFDVLNHNEWYHPNSKGHDEYAKLLETGGTFGVDHSGLGENGGSVDVVFVIDTTGSMSDDIAAVKQSAAQLVNQVASNTTSYRFAVVDYRDFPSRTGASYDYPSHLDLDFTSDPAAIQTAISSLTLGYGGDYPETAYSGLMTGLDLSWRPGVKKVVVQMGDAPPLDPEPFTGYTANDVVATAMAVDPAQIYAVDVSYSGGATGPLASIAERTGGEVVTASSPSVVSSTLFGVIDTALHTPYAWAGGPYVAKTGEAINFDASGSFDNDGTLVRYEWDFNGDGTYDQTTTTPGVSYTYPSEFNGTMTVRVTDNSGAATLATARVDVSNDGDEVPIAVDNCPNISNPGQEDWDGDGIGDACDPTPGFPTADKPGVVAFDADETPPQLTVPQNMTVEANTLGGANVTYQVSATDSAGTPLTPVCTPPSGSFMALGATTVQCQATDAAGQSSQASFGVDVVDSTPPTISGVPGNIALTATSSSGAAVNYAAPTATDVADGNLPVTCDHPSGSTFLGTTTVTCSATDHSGNRAQASFRVTVTYGFVGFLSPLDGTANQTIKAGQTVPVKWQLKDSTGGYISDLATVTFVSVVGAAFCPLSGPTVTTDASTAIPGFVRYDSTAHQYILNWQSPKTSGTCMKLTVNLADGTNHSVLFTLR